MNYYFLKIVVILLIIINVMALYKINNLNNKIRNREVDIASLNKMIGKIELIGEHIKLKELKKETNSPFSLVALIPNSSCRSCVDSLLFYLSLLQKTNGIPIPQVFFINDEQPSFSKEYRQNNLKHIRLTDAFFREIEMGQPVLILINNKNNLIVDQFELLVGQTDPLKHYLKKALLFLKM